MKTEKILFMCNTPYQLLMASNIAWTRYNGKSIEVIVSNHFNSKKIVENINITKNIFSKAYYVESLEYSRRKGNFASQSKKGTERLLYGQNVKKMLEYFVNLDGIFSELWLANFESFSELLFNYIRRYINKSVKVYCYEDGQGSYYDDFFFNTREYEKSFKRRCFERYFLNIIYSTEVFCGYYVMYPEDMVFTPPVPVCRIEPFDINDRNFLDNINSIFDYEKCNDIYDLPIIFFEESYYADGSEMIDDVGIIERLAESIGRDNIMVKLHPRNPINRFKRLGYKTNKNTEIPWELIVLNQEISKSILISISSSAVLSAYTIKGIRGRSIYLSKIINIRGRNHNYETYIEKLLNSDEGKVVEFPTSEVEFLCLVKKYLEDKTTWSGGNY